MNLLSSITNSRLPPPLMVRCLQLILPVRIQKSTYNGPENVGGQVNQPQGNVFVFLFFLLFSCYQYSLVSDLYSLSSQKVISLKFWQSLIRIYRLQILNFSPVYSIELFFEAENYIKFNFSKILADLKKYDERRDVRLRCVLVLAI